MNLNTTQTKPETSADHAADGSMGVVKKENVLWADVTTVREGRRETILRHVANILRERRISTFTLQDVASELGMTKGSLYYYFKDKQELIFCCHMRSMEHSLHALETARAADLPPVDALRMLLGLHIRAVVNKGFGALLQTDLENLNPKQREDYVGQRDVFEHGVRALIQEGVSSGELECSNVKIAGFTMLGAINWIPKWYDPNGPLSEDQIAELIADQLVNGLLLRGGERFPTGE